MATSPSEFSVSRTSSTATSGRPIPRSNVACTVGLYVGSGLRGPAAVTLLSRRRARRSAPELQQARDALRDSQRPVPDRVRDRREGATSSDRADRATGVPFVEHLANIAAKVSRGEAVVRSTLPRWAQS